MAVWGVVMMTRDQKAVTGGRRVVTGGDKAVTGGGAVFSLQRAAVSPTLHAHLTPKIMAEYWKTVEERAQATVAVWQQHFASLTLGATDSAAFVLLTGGLC